MTVTRDRYERRADEQWRYACPHCGSCRLRKRLKTHISREIYVEVSDKTMGDKQLPHRDEIADWYCRSCQTPVDNPIDKKEHDDW